MGRPGLRMALQIHDATERAKASLRGVTDTASHTIDEVWPGALSPSLRSTCHVFELSRLVVHLQYTGRVREGVDSSKAAAHDMKEETKQVRQQHV